MIAEFCDAKCLASLSDISSKRYFTLARSIISLFFFNIFNFLLLILSHASQFPERISVVKLIMHVLFHSITGTRYLKFIS